MFNNLNVALYVSGSIAAYKSLTLARDLIKQGANVRVIMTNSAQLFVTPLAFQTLTKNKVFTNISEEPDEKEITHINIAKWADISLIAPATANFISKIANGIADDAASTTLLATNGKKILVPAMNDNMWNNPATIRNINTLKNDGIIIFSPTKGYLAEGYSGKGRMIEPELIIEKMESNLSNSHLLEGKKVIVTAGGTRESIDPVRYISNNSSGKMGYAIADAAINAGADVTLISAPSKLTANDKARLISVNSSADMENAVKENFYQSDILIMAAAVSDYKPVSYSDQKIKKNDDNLVIKLSKTNDILKAIAKIKSNQFVIGFAAETQNLIENAKSELKHKNLDMLVANDVSGEKVGFNSDNNKVYFIDNNGIISQTGIESKQKISNDLIKLISERIDK
ncbi:bifunctional phosphopantothenoylcysteine decarboxylase/phosphopantothenate--cysteine ligase CoaBC [Apilactobacillus micheneri]|uniref:Coenzyme A biosynthesis bifunctional protein CoaBC n=1 Tax=Apilactobacillus micheneri TaxID=1899430 RepID=A0A9Q8IPD1_9LACO|nr:bifunctional phosphopantothenoylcysteine decarboxylase/phosphopantothenate--cysteine ligase CoaBC [Apilactobacillus micheneri]TPR40575.1 bifunctional phosphopantothenoylcysteine decarboxylase/phosphopantothenate--cysteine ligase CoaBC [Apilactobacillus micheneri]TPR42042.1 bifunctional phosphopantothenoylcysteine decarboxylase/phosphopantothenate--cysteine ligase CoaBC [Apilactobacillus micheneri]TPR44697.1 bifunctional phosphopantothenoylcysteine decarboxylase/phosphopantothenate--cysteine l